MTLIKRRGEKPKQGDPDLDRLRARIAALTFGEAKDWVEALAYDLNQELDRFAANEQFSSEAMQMAALHLKVAVDALATKVPPKTY